jgi:hypothetical protein
VRFAESAGKAYDVDPGISNSGYDYAFVNVVRFTEFIALLVHEYVESQHDVLRLQLPPVILPGLVMLERAGRPLDIDHPEGVLLAVQARSLGKRMVK